MDKMKVMCCKVRTGQADNLWRWPCAVCKAGVGSNSINCTACGKWVYKRCSGLNGSLNVVGFECSRYVHGNTREAAEVKKKR